MYRLQLGGTAEQWRVHLQFLFTVCAVCEDWPLLVCFSVIFSWFWSFSVSLCHSQTRLLMIHSCSNLNESVDLSIWVSDHLICHHHFLRFGPSFCRFCQILNYFLEVLGSFHLPGFQHFKSFTISFWHCESFGSFEKSVTVSVLFVKSNIKKSW